MSVLQVLVATMHQSDLSLVEKMNIRCDTVIANQTDGTSFLRIENPYGTVKMISTHTRGVGLNRNIALLASDAEFVLFSDDDMYYNDDMPQAVAAAFRNNPQADVLVFGVDMSRDGQIYERRRLTNRRLRVWNAMRFGTYRIAARRSALVQHNITFNQNFGGGCPFSSGEDSLFLKACFDCGLKVYGCEYVLGICAKDSSSWFTGYHEKYFYDKGVLMRYLFPRIPRLMAIYFAVRFKHATEMSAMQRVRWMLKGVNNSKAFRPYRNDL